MMKDDGFVTNIKKSGMVIPALNIKGYKKAPSFQFGALQRFLMQYLL
jgi:uncharacterized protein YktB (UPF0637 family)